MLSKDFKEFVELLIKNKAEYLIVGGYAVGVHGHPRYTGDLDIWLNPKIVNAESVLKAIHEFGFSSIDITIHDLTQEGNIIQLGYPPLRIDLLNEIDGVEFDTCYVNKKVIKIDGIQVNIIGYQDLLKNKKASGRLRDLDDIDQLTDG